ncbi:hypothetical protein ACLESO_21635 [Pyxidicoccus sp. 3LG]
MSRNAFSLAKALALSVLCACGTEEAPPVTTEETPPVTQSLREGDDHGDTLATATPVEPEGRASGCLDIDTDQDLFSFCVKAGRIYRFHCFPSSGGYTSSCTVTLLDANGQALPHAKSWTGLHYHSGVVAEQDGVLYARVTYTPYSDSGRARTYSTYLLDLGPDDFADTPAQAILVESGSTTTGRLELAGDVDAFALDVVEGRTYRVSCAGLSSQCNMKVRNPQGQVLDIRGHQLPTGAIVRDLTELPAGRYTVELSTFGVFPYAGVGDYTFSVNDLEP